MAAPGYGALFHFLRSKASADGALAKFSAPEREARLFAYLLEHLPIGIALGETLAGDFGVPYMDPQSREELDQALRPSAAPTSPPLPSQDPFLLLRDRFHCTAGYSSAHTCTDDERVIRTGIAGILSEVKAAQEHASPEQADMLRAMEIALRAFIHWAHRYADLGRRMAEQTQDPKAREALNTIEQTCRRVPEHPPTTFHEGIQTICLVRAAVGISELSEASLSLGRPDQYLYPLFVGDIERGVPLADLERSVKDLWRKLNRFGDPATTINLGGMDADGRDLFNPLSAMMVRVTKELRLPAPLLAARIHDHLPTEAFDLYVDRDLLTLGQPTFYGEMPCREALVRRGVPPADACRFAANSCMGLVVPGEEISDMWGAVLNLLLPLELALNNGLPFQKDLSVTLSTPARDGFATFDDLFAQFARYLDEMAALLVRRNWESTQCWGKERPNPFFSALIRDCIARGRDRALGGPRYHIITFEAFGWANAADALTAVKRLVFDEKRYAIADLVAAARRNFEGFPDLRAAILRCPKYGNADAEADGMAARVADTFAKSVRRHSHDTFYYAPSFHTLNAHIGAGKKLGASLDGRLAGQPLSKNVGPMLGRSRNGLTSVLLSASAVDQRAMSGGQALDISLDPAIIRSKDGRRKFQSLLRAYFSRGGLQVQVNGVTADQLRKAIADPRAYEDLTVKIAGYSARFVSLSREVQDEMIQRFEQGL